MKSCKKNNIEKNEERLTRITSMIVLNNDNVTMAL